MKIIVFTLTAVTQIAVGAFAFLILLVGLNGFHEDDATPSLIMYIVLTLASAIGLGLASVYATKRLSAASVGNFGAAAIAVLGFAFVGGIILIIGWFAALFLAEIMRQWK
jgi:uncharacterized protein YqgC (DUF456 family)